MRGITFGAFSLSEPRARRPDGAEPRLFAERNSRPAEDPAVAGPGRLSETPIEETATEEPVPAISPSLAMRGSGLAPTAPRLSAGTLLHLALVGLVASLIVGAFFGVGLLLLAGPERKTIAAAEPNSSHPSPPASLEPGLPPHSAAAAAIPSPTATQRHQAESQSPPLPSVKPAPTPPPPPPSASPAQAVSTHPAPIPAARPAAAAIGPMDVATGTAPPSPLHAAPPHPAASRSARVRRLAHARSEPPRSEPRHPHIRSPRFARSPALSRPRVVPSGTPSPPGQIQAFDQLLTQLTAPTKSVGHASPAPSLTPPTAGQPNPFAQDGGSR